jgi:hypothetical protein
LLEESTQAETLQGLLGEAFAAGLTTASTAPSPEVALEILHRVRTDIQPLTPRSDLESESARRSVESERTAISVQLRDLLTERDLLLDQEEGEGGYSAALSQQLGRLSSLELFDTNQEGHEADHTSDQCPVCGSSLSVPNPSVTQLLERLSQLREDLAGLQSAEPARQQALSRIEAEVTRLRTRALEVDSTIATLDSQAGRGATADQREFIRGRIDASIARVHDVGTLESERLASELESARLRVASLEEALDDDAARARLSSRLAAIARDMTSLAEQLELEHSNIAVRLDVEKLTVYVDTEDAPVESRIVV